MSYESAEARLPIDFIISEFRLGRTIESPTYAARGQLGEIWRLRTTRGEWAVKRLLVPDPFAGHDIDFQMAAIEAGLPLPVPILTKGEKPVLVASSRAKYRVYQWVELDDSRAVSPSLAGDLLARVHALHYDADYIDPWYYRPVPRERLLQRLAEAEGAREAWAAPLAERMSQILATLDTVPPDKPDHLIRCHLDFNRSNVLLDTDRAAWIIDWENSGGGNPTQELAQALLDFCNGDPAVAELVDGYLRSGGQGVPDQTSDFAMAFVVQANFIEHLAAEALECPGNPALRPARLLQQSLDRLMTVEHAERVLRACREAVGRRF